MNTTDKLNEIEQQIRESAALHEIDKIKMLKNIQAMRAQKVNMLITGVTGSGKSSTINALFGQQVAKVGMGVDPETMEIDKYIVGGLTIWDSPGLGDGIENDKRHSKKIIELLQQKDEEGNALIDMVLLILDGSQRDYGTSYELLTKVLVPYLGEEGKGRILVAINQADQAKKGRGWDREANQPTDALLTFLEQKVASTQSRIKASTGVDIEPIYYSAGYQEEGEVQIPYNLSKLLYFIIKHTPKNKASTMTLESNADQTMWGSREEDKQYQEKISKHLLSQVLRRAEKGVNIGRKLGANFGPAAQVVGGIVGGVVGGVIGMFF
ncbi:GTPase [uncultured Psychromonas sp.]|uniref:GTPase family protein n=1 Tax=uncultured Psychromonas sp. TaxID=173974 RepID=UPI002623B816|nr:GTPase [uncultured Psychromonas sp.]